MAVTHLERLAARLDLHRFAVASACVFAMVKEQRKFWIRNLRPQIEERFGS